MNFSNKNVTYKKWKLEKKELKQLWDLPEGKAVEIVGDSDPLSQ